MAATATARRAKSEALTPAQEARRFAAATKERRKAGRPISQAEFFAWLSHHTGWKRSQVKAMWESVIQLVGEEIGRGGPGVTQLPGLCRIRKVDRAARKARMGVNPFTGKPVQIPAKRASKALRIRPAKALKGLV